jgi:hypothetical protein
MAPEAASGDELSAAGVATSKWLMDSSEALLPFWSLAAEFVKNGDQIRHAPPFGPGGFGTQTQSTVARTSYLVAIDLPQEQAASFSQLLSSNVLSSQ